MRRRVWTFGRKLAGNLVPLLIASPFVVLAALSYSPDKGLSSAVLWSLAGFVVVGWLAVNFTALLTNQAMRDSLGRDLDRARAPKVERRHFVGVARPGFAGVLDPHEDVGFLILHDETIEFYGDSLRLSYTRSQVEDLQYRPNIHSLLGLGRWLALRGGGNRQVQLLIEPRERATLVGNLLYSRRLRDELVAWQKRMGPGQESGAHASG